MPKFTARVVVDYDDVLDPKMTTAKRNELLRDMVFSDIKDALKIYGLDNQVLEVRKVQNG